MAVEYIENSKAGITEAVRKKLISSYVHSVIDTIGDLPSNVKEQLIEKIETDMLKLARTYAERTV